MADWSEPALSSAYTDFLNSLKTRDVDAGTLFIAAPTNPIEGSIRYVRASNKFQEYLSGVWTDKVLSVAGGGTGAATAANARTNLGLGTIATQDADNVVITGGAISGITFAASVIGSGNFSPARMPVGGSWAALTSKLVQTGHAFQVAGFGAGYRTGGATTLADTDYVYVCTGGNVTIPNAIGFTNRILIVKRDGTSVTLLPTAGQTFDGASSIVLSTDKEVVAIQSDGANWNIIGRANNNVSNIKSITAIDSNATASQPTVDFDITISVTDYTKCVFIPSSPLNNGQIVAKVIPISNSVLRVTYVSGATDPWAIRITGKLIEYQNVG